MEQLRARKILDVVRDALIELNRGKNFCCFLPGNSHQSEDRQIGEMLEFAHGKGKVHVMYLSKKNHDAFLAGSNELIVNVQTLLPFISWQEQRDNEREIRIAFDRQMLSIDWDGNLANSIIISFR